MSRALYEPGLGYYATSRQRPTRAGDFLTAPELHPIFGKAIARQVDEIWRRLGEPAHFTLREYGAGRGTLANAMNESFRYEPVEFADARPGRPIAGCVLANEFLDALPVHRVVMEGGRLHEVLVGWREGKFAEHVTALLDPRIEEWFTARGIELREGQNAEVNLEMLDWVAHVSATLERGAVIVLDYGARAPELYGEPRHSGTLRAFRSHHVSSDLLTAVGRQDLTAHIDLDALEGAAVAAGLDVIGTTTQAEFLVGCGLEELLEAERGAAGEDWEAHLEVRSSVARLLDPRHLGGYSVVVLARGIEREPPLRGLGFALGRR